MAKKDEKEEDEKKTKKGAEEEKDDPSSEVDVEIEGEEKKEPEKKEAKKPEEEEAEVVVDVPGESKEEKEERSKSQQRKQRQREAREAKEREIAALRAQNAELVGRVSAIEQRGFSNDVGRIESGLDEAQRQMQEAKDIIKRAVEEKNGEALAQAQEALFDARRRAEKLLEYKQGLASRAQQQKQTPPDPLLIRHAQDWMSKNRWYDPRGFDQDSQIALSIDQKLASDGWDPRTPEYWDEFSNRVSKYLPHRVQPKKQEEDDDDEPASSQTRGSGRESSGGSSKSTFRVSKDRVDALKEAGQWDDFQKDPKFRQRMIRRFKEADEKHSTK